MMPRQAPPGFTMGKIKVIHLTTSVSRLAGGPFQSIRHLARGVAAVSNKFQVAIVGTHDSYTDRDIESWSPLAVRTHKVRGPQRFGYARGMATDLLSSGPDLVHVHGMWQYPSIAVLRWARRTGKPYIVSPHGMIEPWSLQQSRFKKLLAGWLYQWPCLEKAACIRATSTLEAQSIRLAGFKNPIALIPNGVEVPEVGGRRSDNGGRPGEVANQGLHGPGKAESGSQKSEVRRALFLSRIHPKKGLLNLVKAWAIVQKADGGRRTTDEGRRKPEARRQTPDVGSPSSVLRPPSSDVWELLIVGPDEGGHLAEVRAAVRAAGLEKQILFQGEAMGEAKTRLYCESDLFVLPSYSENFGLVIAEALSCGVPVITTHATPWEELETHRCGWWIETGVESLVKALREAMALSDVERSEMGRRGRQLIEDHYTWPAIARQMCAVYEWMLGAGPRPDCVV
jgi:glycosyltransferase involved in cell wall biosynthesis